MRLKSEDLDLSMKCIQYMLLVANFLFLMVALLLMSIGTVIKTMYDDFYIFLNDKYFSPAELMIMIGLIMFFISFFGCWGAFNKSTSLIHTYAILLIIVLVLEMVVVIKSIDNTGNVADDIDVNMRDMMKEYKKGNSFVQEVYDFTQAELQCCGINEPNDWFSQKNHTWYLTDQKYYPRSCCLNDKPCGIDLINGRAIGSYYTDGCKNKLSTLISGSSLLLTSGAICVAVIQVAGVAFARLLAGTVAKIKLHNQLLADQRKQQIYSQFVLEATLANDGARNVNLDAPPSYTAATATINEKSAA